ncbi:MAG: hypothetical protein JKY91_04445, partial [Emcibacter sp.]|nr:hypothetical protein [Emcibacter sp.]
DLTGRMISLLKEWTGENWIISLTTEQGDDTLYEQDQEAERQLTARLMENPLIKAVLTQFPGAKISDIRKKVEEFTLLDDGSSDFINEDFLIGEDEFGLD